MRRLSDIIGSGVLHGDLNSVFISIACPHCGVLHHPGRLRVVIHGSDQGLLICEERGGEIIEHVEIDRDISWYIGVV